MHRKCYVHRDLKEALPMCILCLGSINSSPNRGKMIEAVQEMKDNDVGRPLQQKSPEVADDC